MRYSVRKRILSAILCPILCPWALAQPSPPPPMMAPDAKPTYEVATVKPSQPNERRLFQVDGLKLRTSATTLADLMSFAFSVHSMQIVGGPAWIRSDRYDIVMQPDLPGRPSTAQMRVIMQQLLADRFQLQLHHASKELDVYSIVPSRRGAHLSPVTADEAAANTAAVGFGPGIMTAKNASLSEFANLLNRYAQLEWPVVDDTRIAGKFDFKITWTPDASQPGDTPPAPLNSNSSAAARDLFAAMDEQLGLELKAVKEPADVLVIDRVAKPSDN